MKTQIIQLEPHDDVISARDKIGWGQTGRILLVWPGKRRILTRRLDLQLLQRHSDNLGAQLALVTHNPDVRFFARQMGIPIFRSIRQSQEQSWPDPPKQRSDILHPLPEPESGEQDLAHKRPDLVEMRRLAYPAPAPWVTRTGFRLAWFSLGVFAVIALMGVLLPSAVINLAPSIKTQTTSFTVQASPTNDRIYLSGSVPAKPLSIIVEGRSRIKTTGQNTVPSAAAIGSIRLTNLTDQPISVPQGTVIRSEGPDSIRFFTFRTARLPGGRNRTLEIPIRALIPGSQGNLPARSLQSIEGPLGFQIRATNPRPTLAGADITIPAPSSIDRQQLYRRLLTSLRKTALSEVDDRVDAGDVILTTEPVFIRELEKTFQPAGNQPAEELELTLRVEFEVYIVQKLDLEILSMAILDTSIPEGFVAMPQTLSLVALSEPEIETNGEASWRLSAIRDVIARIGENTVINLSMGLLPDQAVHQLTSQLPISRPPTIVVNPDWWPRLPILPFRIQVNWIRR